MTFFDGVLHVGAGEGEDGVAGDGVEAFEVLVLEDRVGGGHEGELEGGGFTEGEVGAVGGGGRAESK